MAIPIQLDLFQEMDEINMLQQQINLVDKKCSNVQRGLFSRFANMEENLAALWELCHQQRFEISMLKKQLGHKAEIIEFSIPKPKKYKKGEM